MMAIDTSKRFSYEWSKYPQIYSDYEEQFLGWISPLDKSFIQGKIILDAGCGMGRNSYWCLSYGAKEMVAIDNDDKIITAAKKNLGDFHNILVKKENIYNLDYKEYFDFVFSIGVIHHLEFPRQALLRLKQTLKKGGTLLVWLYGRQENAHIIKSVNILRRLLSKFPECILHYIAFIFSIPLFLYVRLSKPNHPYLKRISKYKLLHIHSIVFDQLLPTIAHYYTEEEVRELFKDFGKVQILNKENYSWTVICKV
jgi:2-polyprenyl-3-methyl-5-hydroxy-6-metoxy-1,4-benzoquinol methylase